MSIIKTQCPYCKKTAKEKNHVVTARYRIIRLECGHTITQDALKVSEEKIISLDGKELRPFQYDGIKLAEQAGLRFLFADEMGLGKTPQVLGALRRHPEAFPALILVKAALKHQWARECVRWLGPEHAPVIVHDSKSFILPGFSVYIIGLDLLKNLDLEKISAQINPKTIVIDECQTIKNAESKRTKAVRALCSGKIIKQRVYVENLTRRKKIQVIAQDLMRYHGISDRFELRFASLEDKALGECACKVKGEGIIVGRITLDVKHAENDNEADVIDTILHEIAHAITPGAGHRPIWYATAKSIGNTDGKYSSWCNGTVEPKDQIEVPKFVLAASGTPIKNHALEYFPILNILRPEIFPSPADFQRRYLGGVRTAYGFKPGGIREDMIDSFMETTKEFVVRRERKEVAPDLPLINRTFFNTELGEIVEKAYVKMLEKFQEAYDQMDGNWGNAAARQNVLVYITKMRHLAGIAKVDPCVDWVSDFLFETERKLCIFVHHQDVHEMLKRKLDVLLEQGGFNPCLSYTSDLNSDKREEVKAKFINNPNDRIMLLSTLSAGEGLDGLQKVCADMLMLERQWNPANEEQVEGRFSRIGAQFNQVNSVYFLATGTIDEYFATIVENKRVLVKQVMTGEDLGWHEDSLMRELADLLASKGGKRWQLKK